MDIIDEKKLVLRAQIDPEAFGLLYELYYDKIFNYVLRRTGKVEVSQDITGETFLKAFKKIKAYEWKNISFGAWLYKIANHEIATYYRKGQYKAESIEALVAAGGLQVSADYNLEEEIVQAEETLNRHQEFLAYRQKIEELPVKYQEVLALRYFELKQVKEISEILVKSEGTR